MFFRVTYPLWDRILCGILDDCVSPARGSLYGWPSTRGLPALAMNVTPRWGLVTWRSLKGAPRQIGVCPPPRHPGLDPESSSLQSGLCGCVARKGLVWMIGIGTRGLHALAMGVSPFQGLLRIWESIRGHGTPGQMANKERAPTGRHTHSEGAKHAKLAEPLEKVPKNNMSPLWAKRILIRAGSRIETPQRPSSRLSGDPVTRDDTGFTFPPFHEQNYIDHIGQAIRFPAIDGIPEREKSPIQILINSIN
jgi:hypothetical protein